METFFTCGLNEDVKGNYKNAIEFYTKSIENEELNLEAHLNLIVILTQICFDYGVTSHLILHKVYTQDEINKMFEYLNTLLQKSSVVFDSNEILFWKYYKENYYTRLERDRVKEIIEKDDSNLVPYFQLYIYDLANDNETLVYEHKIKELKRFLREKQTIKNKYILSLIESAENQERLNQNY